MDNIKLSERHRQALDYAVAKIKSSIPYPYVSRGYLFGSCARGEAGWESNDSFEIRGGKVVRIIEDKKRKEDL